MGRTLTLLGISRPHVQDRPAPRVLRIPSIGILAAAGLVTGAALMPVVQTSNATTTGYENRRMEARKADLQAAIYNAQTEIAQLGSLERIDTEARGRLGMVPADRTTIVTVQEAAPVQRQVPARFLPQPEEQEQQQAKERGGWRALLSRLTIR